MCGFEKAAMLRIAMLGPLLEMKDAAADMMAKGAEICPVYRRCAGSGEQQAQLGLISASKHNLVTAQQLKDSDQTWRCQSQGLLFLGSVLWSNEVRGVECGGTRRMQDNHVAIGVCSGCGCKGKIP